MDKILSISKIFMPFVIAAIFFYYMTMIKIYEQLHKRLMEEFVVVAREGQHNTDPYATSDINHYATKLCYTYMDLGLTGGDHAIRKKAEKALELHGFKRITNIMTPSQILDRDMAQEVLLLLDQIPRMEI